MTDTRSPSSSAPDHLLARAIGVLTSPRATYAAVATRPRILGALVLVLILTIAPTVVFLSTEVGQEALFDVQIRRMESFGMQISDQMYAGMERQLRYAPYITAGGQLVVLPVFMAIISGLVIALFTAIMGGAATFKQVYAIVAHAGFIPALQALFSMPLNYVRASMSSPTNLGVFLPFLDESSFLARFLGALDLFIIWYAISLAIGVGVLYRKRTAPIAWGFLALYAVIAFVIAAVGAAFTGA